MKVQQVYQAFISLCLLLFITIFIHLFSADTVYADNSSYPLMDYNTERPGPDYRDFEPLQPRAELCAEACDADPQCKAWTYVKAGIPGPNGHCWLKKMASAPKRNPNCISGVKNENQAPPTELQQSDQDGMDIGYDRSGSGYKLFIIPEKNPKICRDACRGETDCLAWSYQISTNTCRLKEEQPLKTENPDMISGIKDTEDTQAHEAMSKEHNGIQYGVAHYGFEISSFSIQGDQQEFVCQAVCKDNPKCRAWTFQTPDATCHLLSTIRTATRNKDAISGIKLKK